MAAVLLCAFASLSLITSTTHAADPKSVLNASDTGFVKEASQMGLAEVQIASLGARKAARADVKALAEKIIADHSAANTELATLAKSKGVMVSAVTDPDDTEKMKDLENEDTGNGFEKAFLAELEDNHEASIELYEDAAEDAEDAEVKAWAAKMLPKLRAHLAQVQELQKK